MIKWKSLVDSFFRNSDPEGEFRHIANPPASTSSIAAAEAKIGLSIPEELRDFYLCYNGIGLAADDEPDTPRLIQPIEDLPDFIAQCRSWFSETHPDFASRFFPFLDWENGDVMGFMFQQDGTLHPFLVTFMHEQYNFSASQNAEEFLEQGPESLAELLTP